MTPAQSDPQQRKGLAKGLAQGSATGLAEGPAKGLAKVLAKEIAKGLATGLAKGLAGGPTQGLAEGATKGHKPGVEHTRVHASVSRQNPACVQAVVRRTPLACKRGFGAMCLRVPLRVPLCA